MLSTPKSSVVGYEHAVMKSVPDAQNAVLVTAKEMLRRGLVEGTSGNISARLADGNVVCTPSSVDYAEMLLDDLVVVNPAGEVVLGKAGRSPTSELQLHLACYAAFEDVGSVVHAHPVWATMFACSHEPVPACVDEFTMYIGGDVRCAEYAMSGSADVGENAIAALQGRGAALLANHGLVAVGPSPSKVLHIVALVERTAQIAWGARALGGIVPIPDKVNQDFAGVYQLMRSL
jgi:L-fuculose-phosphate aldolase